MADNKTYAVFQTNRGDFTVELFVDKAPITVENFGLRRLEADDSR